MTVQTKQANVFPPNLPLLRMRTTKLDHPFDMQKVRLASSSLLFSPPSNLGKEIQIFISNSAHVLEPNYYTPDPPFIQAEVNNAIHKLKIVETPGPDDFVCNLPDNKFKDDVGQRTQWLRGYKLFVNCDFGLLLLKKILLLINDNRDMSDHKFIHCIYGTM
ncbi:hypothetical protein CEXT_417211 [Caerostris extrusa]|uniref:Uncharacterized protein n=1 Tax=Caerostris extrusa TaxID=172846 RepID=A0AAV4QEV9_CAEEX|nr:hypothetical protein CEXT_417211 [Caerostris extrusa]